MIKIRSIGRDDIRKEKYRIEIINVCFEILEKLSIPPCQGGFRCVETVGISYSGGSVHRFRAQASAMVSFNLVADASLGWKADLSCHLSVGLMMKSLSLPGARLFTRRQSDADRSAGQKIRISGLFENWIIKLT